MRTLGLLIMAIGGGIVVWAIINALFMLGDIYNHLLTDPLAEPAVAEEDQAAQILSIALRGAIGLPLLSVGFIMSRVYGRRKPIA
jgi:hypothetical protein